MPFLFFLVLVLALQVAHRRLLLRELPDRWRAWITPVLILIHLPLALYMGLRISGSSGMVPGIRPPARAALYFQMLSAFHLVVAGLAALAWKLRHRGSRATAPEDPGRRKFLRQTSVLGAGLATYGVLVGRREAHQDPEIVRLDLAFDDLPPGLDGLRLAQLSDLHSGPLVRPWQIQRWRELAQAERPELLLFTGDFVDSLPEEGEVVARAFRDFPAPLGRFAILGNHDYFTDPRPIWSALEAGGITLLENRWAQVERRGSRLTLVGLQDPMATRGHFRNIRYGAGPDPVAATRGLSGDTWRLALSHRPNDWPLAQKAGARLTLSGHTHGGQINLIPGVSSALLAGPYTSGVYRKGRNVLYVTRGLGVVALPVRIGAPPELTVITLRRR